MISDEKPFDSQYFLVGRFTFIYIHMHSFFKWDENVSVCQGHEFKF